MVKTITTNAEVADLIMYLKDKQYVALDTETTGVDKDSTIIGYSVCAEEDLAYYVVTQYWDKLGQQLVPMETVETSPMFMESLKSKDLIGHNILFDTNMIRDNWRVDLIDYAFMDTMLAAQLTDENRSIGLKALGAHYLGASATQEQEIMQASVIANGGKLTKANYELYKADYNLIAEYGAKDAEMTFKLMPLLIDELVKEDLVDFYFDETMPLLRGPTNDLNSVGLTIDSVALNSLRKSLEVETLELRGKIHHDIDHLVRAKYPGTCAKNTFNIGSCPQLSWLLFDQLKNTFPTLSDAGQDLCRAMSMKLPYNNSAKKEFIDTVRSNLGTVWGGKKVKEYWNYLSTNKEVLDKFSEKYRWVKYLQQYKTAKKTLTTYVDGIEEKIRCGIVHPNFKQHGTTSGRYSCSTPNFQQLPRDDKRVKSCIVSRPGNVFVGADYSQLEPRCFASISGDISLMECFTRGKDFYSVVGMPTFGITGCSEVKSDGNSFASLYPKLRDKSKVIALATPYGRTARQQAQAMGIPEEESQALIDSYFAAYPLVEQMMLNFHKEVKESGYVKSMFGRKRRIPEALKIRSMYGEASHNDLPYTARNMLNLAVNHPIQSAGASITNRAMIRFKDCIKDLGWTESVSIVLQVHDSIVVECPENVSPQVSDLLRDCMENTTVLPGVKLEAIPKIGKTLADV